MANADSTCWTVIRGAARGSRGDRRDFARRYEGVIRAYLRRRWAGSSLVQDVEDAVQEVFVECFREDGALERVRETGSFRAFLFGVVRNVARRQEALLERRGRRRAPSGIDLAGRPSDDESLATAFDREWALRIMKEAAETLRRMAAAADAEALRRVELLDLRFREGRPIRDIAAEWDVEPARLHHDYARARRDFESALLEVVAFHHPGDPGEVRRECRRLLEVLR